MKTHFKIRSGFFKVGFVENYGLLLSLRFSHSHAYSFRLLKQPLADFLPTCLAQAVLL